MYRLIAFIVCSAFLVYISRTSLRTPQSHGFYRFFAWEFILALFLLNVKYWFHDPFSWHQMISWCLLIISLIPLAFGIHALVTRGKPAKRRQGDDQLIAFEKTTTLVTSGIYQYIRHPLYSSLLFLAWGIFFKTPSGFGVLLALTSTLFLIATARVDEAECIRFFGSPYQAYMRKTRMFVPYLF